MPIHVEDIVEVVFGLGALTAGTTQVPETEL
jgi:hypothetical protein